MTLFQSQQIDQQPTNSQTPQSHEGQSFSSGRYELFAQGVLSNIANQKQGGIREGGMYTARFQDIRYRVYSFFLLLICILFIRGYEGIGGFVVDAYDSIMASLAEKQNLSLQKADLNRTKERYLRDGDFIKKIGQTISVTEGKIPAIVLCLNRSEECESLDPQIASNLPLIRSFIQLESLNGPKMEIDEGKILKNINEFLLQRDPLSTHLDYNGQLRDLKIGKPQRVQGLLYKIPLSMGITFTSKNDVLSFLANVEKRIHFSTEGGFSYNILYHLESFSYDILNYTNTQDVQAHFVVYYYNKKKGFF